MKYKVGAFGYKTELKIVRLDAYTKISLEMFFAICMNHVIDDVTGVVPFVGYGNCDFRTVQVGCKCLEIPVTFGSLGSIAVSPAEVVHTEYSPLGVVHSAENDARTVPVCKVVGVQVHPDRTALSGRNDRIV